MKLITDETRALEVAWQELERRWRDPSYLQRMEIRKAQEAFYAALEADPIMREVLAFTEEPRFAKPTEDYDQWKDDQLLDSDWTLAQEEARLERMKLD